MRGLSLDVLPVHCCVVLDSQLFVLGLGSQETLDPNTTMEVDVKGNLLLSHMEVNIIILNSSMKRVTFMNT